MSNRGSNKKTKTVFKIILEFKYGGKKLTR